MSLQFFTEGIKTWNQHFITLFYTFISSKIPPVKDEQMSIFKSFRLFSAVCVKL